VDRSCESFSHPISPRISSPNHVRVSRFQTRGGQISRISRCGSESSRHRNIAGISIVCGEEQPGLLSVLSLSERPSTNQEDLRRGLLFQRH
jgi:hypothetical protein